MTIIRFSVNYKFMKFNFSLQNLASKSIPKRGILLNMNVRLFLYLLKNPYNPHMR